MVKNDNLLQSIADEVGFERDGKTKHRFTKHELHLIYAFIKQLKEKLNLKT